MSALRISSVGWTFGGGSGLMVMGLRFHNNGCGGGVRWVLLFLIEFLVFQAYVLGY